MSRENLSKDKLGFFQADGLDCTWATYRSYENLSTNGKGWLFIYVNQHHQEKVFGFLER